MLHALRLSVSFCAHEIGSFAFRMRAQPRTCMLRARTTNLIDLTHCLRCLDLVYFSAMLSLIRASRRTLPSNPVLFCRVRVDSTFVYVRICFCWRVGACRRDVRELWCGGTIWSTLFSMIVQIIFVIAHCKYVCPLQFNPTAPPLYILHLLFFRCDCARHHWRIA